MDIVPISAADDGVFTHWVSIQRDVTARKQAEAEAGLRDMQRVESLGTLATGIAHDFNNIIAAILGNVAMGRQEVPHGHPVLANLEQIGNAEQRARRLVQRILAYSRREPQALVRQPLAPIVTEATDLLRSTLPAGVGLSVTLCPTPLYVAADATQIQQVLLNLGTNAWHAMHGRPGHIQVDLLATDGAGLVDGQPQPLALIRVSDDGGGMDAATLARIFEPYFTTKAIGHGTGLGLSVVSGIVQAHGGRIVAASQLTLGSTFRLTLPLLDSAGAAPDDERPAAAPSNGNNQRVALVDDDEVVLLVLSALLTRAGFVVSPFTDTDALLAALRADASCFDIVVTDMNMPRRSGLKLAREVKGMRPGLPVVIGSGYVGDELSVGAPRAGVAAVFCKEFASEQLCLLVHDVLANPQALQRH